MRIQAPCSVLCIVVPSSLTHHLDIKGNLNGKLLSRGESNEGLRISSFIRFNLANINWVPFMPGILLGNRDA